MAEAAQAKFSCPSCGRQFTWKPELAGKGAKCKCGATITVPAKPQAAAPARAPAAAAAPAADEGNPLDGYDFSTAEAAPKKAAAAPADAALRCPSCGGTMLPGAVICVTCGFNLKTGKRMSTVMGGPDPDAAAAAAPRPGGPGLPMYPTTSRPARAESQRDVGAIVKLVAIPLVLVAVIGGAVFGYKKLAGEKDTGPALGDDREVRAMIKDDGATELKQWLKEGNTRMVTGMTREQADGLADRLYEMGAKKVIAFGGVMTMTIAVELPDAAVPENKDKRKAIFDWYKRKYEETLPVASRKRDVGQQWLLVHPGI
jgi:DNA-directed RNA polymerase subunit RPC12/RpoP